jgi:hypothetical protein
LAVEGLVVELELIGAAMMVESGRERGGVEESLRTGVIYTPCMHSNILLPFKGVHRDAICT